MRVQIYLGTSTLLKFNPKAPFELVPPLRSRGFGFVTYASSSMVDESMRSRPHNIDGRNVEAKRAVPRDSKPENGLTSKKLFVAGVKDEISEDDLKGYFNTYGNVVSATIPVDKSQFLLVSE